MHAFALIAFASLLIPLTRASAQESQPRSIKLTMTEGLTFSPVRFSASPGESLIIHLSNRDKTDMPHNCVFLKDPDARLKVMTAALSLGEKGPERHYVPDSPEILAASRLLLPEETQDLTFKSPKNEGVYPFLCTFPGHGILMYGALYVALEMPPLAEDPNIPDTAKQAIDYPTLAERPCIQRVWMPNAGPAAIAVALPGTLNYCWDAGTCSLRTLWEGAFLDATEHWHSKGQPLAKILGKILWQRGPEPLISFAPPPNHPTAQFLGYRLTKSGLPIFKYQLDNVRLEETVEQSPEGELTQVFSLPDAPDGLPLFVRDPSTDVLKATCTLGPFTDGILRAPLPMSKQFTLGFSRRP